MNRLCAAAALMLLPVLTGGCVVAAVPIVAGGVMARDQLKGEGKTRKAKKDERQDQGEPVGLGPAPVARGVEKAFDLGLAQGLRQGLRPAGPGQALGRVVAAPAFLNRKEVELPDR